MRTEEVLEVIKDLGVANMAQICERFDGNKKYNREYIYKKCNGLERFGFIRKEKNEGKVYWRYIG